MKSTNTLDPTIIKTGIRAAQGKLKIINQFLRDAKLKKVRAVNNIDDYSYELIFEDPKEYMVFQLRGGLRRLVDYVQELYVDPLEQELAEILAETIKKQIDKEILAELYKELK